MNRKKTEYPYIEAMRYMNNAEEILETKAGKDGVFYKDIKYVKMACGTAYNGVLLALDHLFEEKNSPIDKKPYQRLNVRDYKKKLSELTEYDILNNFNVVYNVLHIDGYYEGVNRIDVICGGINSAYTIIEAIKPKN